VLAGFLAARFLKSSNAGAAAAPSIPSNEI
jgi:hypothetical protein